jgi:hypothetical protein
MKYLANRPLMHKVTNNIVIIVNRVCKGMKGDQKT